MTMAAWGDESESHPNRYVLGAVLCNMELADDVREAVCRLLLKGQRKLHWRDERSKRQMIIVKTLAALPIHCVVIERDGAPGEHSERRRRLCLERLLHELDQREVGTLTLESRGRVDDHRDRKTLDNLRAKRAITSRLWMQHRGGPADALLWAADSVCGAVTRYRLGDPLCWEVIKERVTMIQLVQ